MDQVQLQIPNVVGNYQTAQANQDASKLTRLQMAVAQQEVQEKIYNRGVMRAAAAGNQEAMKLLSATNPTAAKGLRDEQDYAAAQGARILDSFFALPKSLRTQKQWDSALNEYRQVTGKEPNMPNSKYNAPDDLVSDEVEGYAKSVLTRLKGREQELKEEKMAMEAKPDLSVEETGAGLMVFDKKTGEFKRAKVDGKNLPVYQKPPTSVVNINNTGEGELYKAARKTQGEIYGDYIKQGNKAASNLASLDRAEQLLNEVGATGKLTPIAATMGNVLNQFGVKVDTKKIGSIEELTQLSQTQVGGILGSGEYGAGTGISSTDLSAANKRVYSVDKTVQGNKQIIQVLRALETRKKEAGRITSRLINEGKADQVDIALDALAKNPIFEPEQEDQQNQQQKKQPQTYPEGTIIQNKQGQRLIAKGGQWQKI